MNNETNNFEKTADEKSMETTFKILDGFDVIGFFDTQNSTGGGNECDIRSFMSKLESRLKDEVSKYPELEGCLFNYVNHVEFAEYLEKRYKGRLYTREVITTYIGRCSNAEGTDPRYIYTPFVMETKNVPLAADTTLKNVCPDEIPDKGPSAPIFIHRKDIPAAFSNTSICELHSQLNNLSDDEIYDMYSRLMVHIYHRTHKCCPKCGSKALSMTLLGFPAMTYGVSLDCSVKNFHYTDNNSVKCQDCGWSGVIDDLKEEIKFNKVQQ